MTTHFFRPETIAIIEATRDMFVQQHAALTLRMWHHMQGNPDRDAVFLNQPGDGLSLMCTFFNSIACVQHPGGQGGRISAGLRAGDAPVLEEAFACAVRDVMGRIGTPMVLHAWREVLHAYLSDLVVQQGTSPAAAGTSGR